MDYGIIDRLKKTFFYKYTEIPDTQPNYITFNEVVPILLILAAGVMASLIMLCVEIILYQEQRFWYQRRQLSKRKIKWRVNVLENRTP